MARIDYLTEQEKKGLKWHLNLLLVMKGTIFFNLPNAIYKQALLLGKDEAFATFALMFGYFKATNKFLK